MCEEPNLPPERITASAGRAAPGARTVVRYWCSHFKSERHARRIAGFFTATAAAGWRNVLVCSRPPEEPVWTEPATSLGVELVYHPRAHGNFDIACVRRTRALLRSVGCDVFHCDNTHTSPLIGAWLAGVAVRLWSKRAMEPSYEANRPVSLRDRLAVSLRLSCALATRTLAVSEPVADELRQKGIPGGRILVMPNPLDAGGEVRRSREDARAALGLGAGDFVVTTIGRALPVKGWDVLVRAAAAALPRVPALQVLLVGSTEAVNERPVRAEIEQLVAQGGLEGRVRFTGHVSSIDDPLAAADVFVLPSRSEGFSLALVEAMRAGLPVIASRVGIAEAVIQPGRNGFVVPREDAPALAEYLVRLAADVEMRARLAAGARSTSILPTAPEHADALLALYRHLLGEDAPTGEGAPA
jgi:glycosyltransferase involved in cell wall biosynthesis